MHLDPVILARIQFAITVGFHIIFPSISIGLAWMIVLVEWRGWRANDDTYVRLGKFLGRFLAITFVLGVATGITMEFQFGTNWAEYSKFVGDIFGAPLAAEAILAFFLESTFLGLYLFGRGKISKGLHWLSSLIVAFGTTLSVFWILVANSWQQTPAGFTFNPAAGRAELTGFWAAVFNPSTVVRFLHTMDAAIIAGAFFVAGLAAYLLLKDKDNPLARKAIRLAIIVALIASVLEIIPLGHHHAMQVGKYQPEKLATFEGLFEGGPNAPFTVIGIPAQDHLAYAVRIPGLLSFLMGFRFDKVVQGLSEFPIEDRPPLLVPFLSFHVMVGLGTLFVAIMLWAAFRLWRGKLWDDKWLLRALILTIPLPVIATEAGWIAAEVGRQPWIVYKLLKTADAISLSVSAGEILFSLILFTAIYTLIGALFLFLTIREARRGPEPAQ